MNDKITELLWQRSELALKEITAKYGRLLHGLALNILHSEPDAEECVNDALLDIWNTIPPQKPVSISSYACMVTRRRAIDRLRYYTAGKRGGAEYEIALSEISECLSEELSSPSADNDLADTINGFLGGLSKGDRIIFMSRYYGFESIEQIAGAQRISKNAVNIRLTRMRKKLKNYLCERRIFE